MTSQILVLSEKQNDIDFWKKIALREGLQFKNLIGPEEVEKELTANPSSLILWDAGCEKLRGLENLFLKLNVTSRVLVVTDSSVHEHQQLFLPPAFSHHIYRRYNEHAEFLCSQLVRQEKLSTPFKFEEYFKEITARNRVQVNHTTDKKNVVDIFRQTMISNGILERIADLGCDAVDELLMNAIFDAPEDKTGLHYRRNDDRKAEFALKNQETIQADLIISPDLVGIRVVDQFGSLKPDSAILSLGKNFDQTPYLASNAERGAGLGLMKLVHSAASLVFLVNPHVRTESIALIRNTPNYRELRTSFLFFSIHSNLTE